MRDVDSFDGGRLPRPPSSARDPQRDGESTDTIRPRVLASSRPLRSRPLSCNQIPSVGGSPGIQTFPRKLVVLRREKARKAVLPLRGPQGRGLIDAQRPSGVPERQTESRGGDPDAMEAFTILLALMLVLVGLGLGTTMQVNQLKTAMRQPKALVIGMVCQYGLMPVFAYALCSAFNLDKGTALGIILVGSCPGGVSHVHPTNSSTPPTTTTTRRGGGCPPPCLLPAHWLTRDRPVLTTRAPQTSSRIGVAVMSHFRSQCQPLPLSPLLL